MGELPLFANRPGNREQVFLVVINPVRFRPLHRKDHYTLSTDEQLKVVMSPGTVGTILFVD